MPCSSATCASARLIAAASSVPPVMPVMRSGARRRLPRSVGRDVDLVDRQLRQRVVHQVDLLEERRLAGVLDLARPRTARGASACGR